MKQVPIKICITAANGKMGQAIQQQITSRANEFQLRSSLGRSVDESPTLPQYINVSEISPKPDVIVDFSQPEFAMEIAQQAQSAGIAFVTGTTGFTEPQFQQLRQIAEDIPLLWAANMSLGVNLALELVRLSSRVLGEQVQVEITETHHRHKIDAPSGTALALGKEIAATRGQPLNNLISFDADSLEQNHSPDKIGFNVIREGEIIGEHSVSFNLDGEQLNIEHKATDRKLFAIGALRAAKWIASRPPGWYQMKQVLDIQKYLQP